MNNIIIATVSYFLNNSQKTAETWSSNTEKILLRKIYETELNFLMKKKCPHYSILNI